MSDVQALVDALAAELGRPVEVDDQRFRAVAYSAHREAADQVRLASILQREAPSAVIAWLESLGVRETARELRVPANSGFGMAARVCLPLRYDDMLLGFLWLIDEPKPIGQTELLGSLAYAQELAVALHRARRLDHEIREREAVARLLRGDALDGDLPGGGHLASARSFAVLVLQAEHVSREPLPEAVRVRLGDAAEQLRRTMEPGRLLVDASAERVLCVLACASPRDVERRGAALAEAARRNLEGASGWSPLVAASEPLDQVAALPKARAQALEGARVAAALGWSQGLVRWEQLGAYRTIAGMLGGRDGSDWLPESFRRLLEVDDAAALIDTLERYLDLAGDARRAAAELYLHRSSLYGRLHRIEDAAGVDLRSGEDRLELHLALRLWRLSVGAAQG